MFTNVAIQKQIKESVFRYTWVPFFKYQIPWASPFLPSLCCQLISVYKWAYMHICMMYECINGSLWITLGRVFVKKIHFIDCLCTYGFQPKVTLVADKLKRKYSAIKENIAWPSKPIGICCNHSPLQVCLQVWLKVTQFFTVANWQITLHGGLLYVKGHNWPTDWYHAKFCRNFN